MPGRGSGITRELVIFTQPHKRSSENTRAAFPELLDAIRESAGSWPLHRECRPHLCLQSICSDRRSEHRTSARSPFQSTDSDHTGRGRETLWRRASELLPNQGAGKYNSAFMDLGALVCAKRPNCVVCPVRNFCAAETPSELPIRKAPPPIRLRTENHGFSVRRGRVLLEQSQDRWRGMWMLPRLATVPPKRQAPARFGVSVHESSHHLDCVPAEGG